MGFYRRLKNKWNEIAIIRRRVESIDQRLLQYDELLRNQEMFLWPIVRQLMGALPTEDVRKRFYAEIAPASGDLRKIQMTELLILQGLDRIAKEHGLTWWLSSGTLLGAFRHQGFIPWDDDVDVGILRADLGRLMKIVREDPTFEITKGHDAHGECEQVRMKFRDHAPFIDLFPYDFCTACDGEASARRRTLREAFRQEIRCSRDRAFVRFRECGYVEEGAIPKIDRFFLDFQRRMQEEGFVDPAESPEAPGIGKGVEVAGNSNTFPRAWFIPLKTLSFEKTTLPVPRETERLLRNHYGDIYELQIGRDYDHVVLPPDEVRRITELLRKNQMLPHQRAVVKAL